MASPARHFRTALYAVLVAAATALAAYGAGRHAQQQALREQGEQARQQLSLYADALQALIEHYRALPAVLALDPELRGALENGFDPARQAQLDLKLERVNGAATSSTLTLLDRRGYAVAASNWRRPDSNVGHDYSFRPYFRQLAARDDGRFFGVGVTTGVPGYFLSKAVRDAPGRLLGALVVKLELLGLEQEWSKGPDLVLASDSHGVIFLASRLDQRLRYRTLQPLSAAQRAELESAQQYPQQTLSPLPLRLLQDIGPDSRVVLLGPPDGGNPWLWQSLALPSEGWTLHLLRDTAAVNAAGRVASLAAAGTCLSLVFLLLFLQQRWRVARLRRRSREELEQMVKQHTAALRTAQDGLVQAAHLAALGYGESLEHLPQGVSVVDAQLRLVAWNRRYVELFRVPPELMRAGRPIEDILRHNARRGLLGGGDIEEAIRRRLGHLQAAQPYLFERERPDGTVLEIRGNPLPGGGFVTSYADITAYKSAARDLRTLATTLERRVEQRTGELQEAKREAERANRSKTSFVAAAVHDLQQPLNAARMFVHALGERVAGSEPAALVRNVEEALEAQDAILSSLLDIARLESGAIRTQVRDLPLRLLFEALAREFGILAQARGLELRCVHTSAVVRSDEALLRRILQNFLSNAVRYTRSGRVLLGCRRIGSGAGAALRIEVWDSGPGIPEHQRQEIFEEFRRLDGTGEERGAGLGLAIVDRTARLLGHAVGLRSWPGRGSVFSLTLPLGDAAAVSPAAALAAPPPEDSALHGCAVWCIDDDARVREASRVLLERWGCRVTLAAGAAADLARAQAGEAPALVLLDYRLGERTGPELFEELAQRWRARPPVILISAERDAALQELAESRNWGLLYKPVRPPALRALMSQLLARGGG